MSTHDEMSNMPMPRSNYNHQIEGMFMSMRHMSFFWGYDAVVLFSNWPGFHRPGMYTLALVMVFLLAVVAEFFAVGLNLKARGINPAGGAAVLAAMHAVRMGLVYLIMLSVMSFNAGVFLAAVAGHALGLFLVKFRSLKKVARAHEDLGA